MKRSSVVLAILLLVAAATPLHAQQPGTPADPHHPQTSAAPAPVTPSAPPSTGASGEMMPMEMCRQMMMMGGHMGGGMMGMRGMMGMGGGTAPMDPKMMAEMMEMRGEMMKAMGDIMIKHARKMRSSPR